MTSLIECEGQKTKSIVLSIITSIILLFLTLFWQNAWAFSGTTTQTDTTSTTTTSQTITINTDSSATLSTSLNPSTTSSTISLTPSTTTHPLNAPKISQSIPKWQLSASSITEIIQSTSDFRTTSLEQLTEIHRLLAAQQKEIDWIRDRLKKSVVTEKKLDKLGRKIWDQTVGIHLDCTKAACQAYGILKFRSPSGQTLSFFNGGGLGERRSHFLQEFELHRSFTEKFEITGLAILEFASPQVFGLGAKATKYFEGDVYDLAVQLSHNAYLVESSDGTQFYRLYDVKWGWQYSKATSLGIRGFAKESFFFEKTKGSYSGLESQIFIGFLHFFDKQEKYQMELAPYYLFNSSKKVESDDLRYGIRLKLKYFW